MVLQYINHEHKENFFKRNKDITCPLKIQWFPDAQG